MSGAKARRFLDQQGREAGVRTTPGKHAYRFHSLGGLVRASLDRFGRYLDMDQNETDRMLATRSEQERAQVGTDLRQLAANHLTLAERVEPVPDPAATPVEKRHSWKTAGGLGKEHITWVRCVGQPGYRVRLAGINFWWPGYPNEGLSLTATMEDKSWEHLSGEFESRQQATDAIYEYARQYVKDNSQKVEDAMQILQLSGEP